MFQIGDRVRVECGGAYQGQDGTVMLETIFGQTGYYTVRFNDGEKLVFLARELVKISL